MSLLKILQLIGTIALMLTLIDCRKLGKKKDKYKDHSLDKLIKLNKRYSILTNFNIVLVPLSQFGPIFWISCFSDLPKNILV